MHTEDEARTKWCPYSRTVQWVEDGDDTIIGAASGNRASAMADECACIASECMAWRWKSPQFTVEYGTERDEARGYLDAVPSEWADCRLISSSMGPDGIWSYVLERLAGDPDEDRSWMLGYCGLAGEPK